MRRFVNERLIPSEARVEEEDAVPADIIAEMRNMDLFGLPVPQAVGGLGLSRSKEAHDTLRLGGRGAEPLCR